MEARIGINQGGENSGVGVFEFVNGVPFHHQGDNGVAFFEGGEGIVGDLEAGGFFGTGNRVGALDLEVFKDELGKVIAGRDFEGFETTFGVPVLVVPNVGTDGGGDFGLASEDLSGEGVEFGAVKADAIELHGGDHGEAVVVEDGDVLWSGVIAVLDTAVEGHDLHFLNRTRSSSCTGMYELPLSCGNTYAR